MNRWDGSVIPWWAVVLIALLFFLGMNLTGCASAPTFDYAWHQARPPAPRPWFYVTVSDPDRVCREAGAQTMYLGRINACATWTPTNCTIYLPSNPPAWIVEHEERHCLGEVHD